MEYDIVNEKKTVFFMMFYITQAQIGVANYFIVAQNAL